MFSVGEGRVARAYAPSLLRRRATRNSYDFGFKKQALFVLQMECHSLSFACDVNLSSLEQPLRVGYIMTQVYDNHGPPSLKLPEDVL